MSFLLCVCLAWRIAKLEWEMWKWIKFGFPIRIPTPTFIRLPATLYSYFYPDHDHHTMILAITTMIREMRCLRNKIHANLFLTFVLDCTFWMATDIMQGRELPTTGLKVSKQISPIYSMPKDVPNNYHGIGKKKVVFRSWSQLQPKSTPPPVRRRPKKLWLKL